MQDPLDLHSLRGLFHMLHLHFSLTVADLQHIIFQFRKQKFFGNFTFGMILDQQFFVDGFPRLKLTVLFQRIHIFQQGKFFFPVNVHPQVHRPLDPEDPHFSILIQPHIDERIVQRTLYRIIHRFLHAVAGDPALVRHALFQPVCLSLFGTVHTEYEKFSGQEHFVLPRTDFQFPAAYVGQKKLSDTLLCSGQRDLLLDPVCIFLHCMQFQQMDRTKFFVNRYFAFQIGRCLLIRQFFHTDFHFHKRTDPHLAGMYQRRCKFGPHILYKILSGVVPLNIDHFFKRDLSLQNGGRIFRVVRHIQDLKI